MAQTFRTFACDWPLVAPGIPTTEPVMVPVVSWLVLRDGEPLTIEGELAIVSSPYISREYAGIPYENEEEV